MTAPGAPTYLCPNGHGGPPFATARFCNQCGAAFMPYATPPAPPQWVGTTPPVPPPQQWPATPPQPWVGTTPPVVSAPVTTCSACGGDGTRLDPAQLVCPQCRWLRPLAPGYVVDASAFQWGADSAALARLRTIGPLTNLARTMSDRVGRRWVETSFNAIRLGANQLPDIYDQAIRAAQLLGMPFMPDVYVSGDKMWEAVTYGSDRSAFLLLGTALINNYKGDDLLFLLAREMGHCRAGHALWKTVGEFLTGAHGAHKGVMSEGLLGALNPQRLVENAVDVPFLAWARQAEITADRAGLLAIGDEETARRVLLSWSLRSVPLYRQINIEAWLQQQEDGDDQMTRMSEMLTSPTPFITRRLKLLMQFAHSPELAGMRSVIGPLVESLKPVTPPAQVAPPPAQAAPPKPETIPAPDILRVSCPACGTGMQIPRAELAGKDVFRVRCPKPDCGKIMTLRKNAEPAPAV